MTNYSGDLIAGALEGMERAIAVAREAGLDEMAALSQFESFGNENWLYEADDGGLTVIRRYEHAGIPRVRFQLDLQQYLRLNGFLVCGILAMSSGQPYHVDEDGCAWAAFDYVDGRAYDFSLQDAVQAARALAQFHILGASFGQAAPALAHRPSVRECWLNHEGDVQGLSEMFASGGLEDELSYLREWWRFVEREWPLARLDALPSGLVHGDFHGRNLAYSTGGDLVAVFDFDDVEAGPFVQDVAMGLYKFSRESRFSLRLRPEVVRLFVAEYEHVRPLTAEERTALPLMVAMTYPPNPAYYRYYRDHHGTDLERRLRREVTAMRTLRAEVEALE